LIQINIIDSGAGFSETDLPHVFKRLYRGDASRNRQPVDSLTSKALGRSSGSGLGLSIVQQIVQAHSGSVEARNHPETGGAWLQLKLPDRKISP
jgi:two-component system phosphate regulon sensor histidine kinase PhoR